MNVSAAIQNVAHDYKVALVRLDFEEREKAAQ
jgi:hypothetical protein